MQSAAARPHRMSPWRRAPVALLAIVAAVHAVAPLVLLGPRWGFGIDETVYLSQLNQHVPAGLFSAPRARGTTLVAAPITLLTSSTAAVRVWLACLSALGLFLAFRPWLRLRAGYVVPLAALLFSTIWSVAYYGFEAMPNEWVAFAVLAASGATLLYVREGRRGQLGAIVALLAVAALFRPSDAGFAAAGLALACAFLKAPRNRRLIAAAAAVCGTALGALEWVIEAVTSYGGVANRVHLAQTEQGGGGLRFSGLAEARTLAGPLLCRGQCSAHASPVFWLWWVVGGALIAAAVVFGRRDLRLGDDLLPLVVGVATAAQYLLTVSYAAPRFLIPTYALLAIPCAGAIERLVRRAGHRSSRVAFTAAVAVGLAVHAAIQSDVILRRIGPSQRAFTRQMRADAAGLHAVGVTAPCLVLRQPDWDQALAYTTGCSNTPGGYTGVMRAIARGTRVVWLGPTRPGPQYGPGWREIALPGRLAGQVQLAYVSPTHQVSP